MYQKCSNGAFYLVVRIQIIAFKEKEDFSAVVAYLQVYVTFLQNISLSCTKWQLYSRLQENREYTYLIQL